MAKVIITIKSDSKSYIEHIVRHYQDGIPLDDATEINVYAVFTEED